MTQSPKSQSLVARVIWEKKGKRKKKHLQRKHCDSLLRTSLATLSSTFSLGTRQLVKQAAGIRQTSFPRKCPHRRTVARPASSSWPCTRQAATFRARHLSARSSQLSELLPFVSSSSLVCEQKQRLKEHKFTLRCNLKGFFVCFFNVRWGCWVPQTGSSGKQCTHAAADDWIKTDCRRRRQPAMRQDTQWVSWRIAGWLWQWDSLPKYLHQFVFETCVFNAAWGGAPPASEIRKDISGRWRQLPSSWIVNKWSIFSPGSRSPLGLGGLRRIRYKLKLSRPALD